MTIKMTEGWTRQEFNDKGECISQKFIAGDNVEYEDDGKPCDPPKNEQYQPHDMVQPGFVQVKKTEFADQREKLQDDMLTILVWSFINLLFCGVGVKGRE